MVFFILGGGKQPTEHKGLEAVLNALPDEVTEGVVPAGTCETIPQIQTLPEDQDIDNVHELHVDKPGPTTSRKRVRVVKYDSTEVESQSSQYLEVEKKKEEEEEAEEHFKEERRGVTLLEMNREIQEVEKRKLEVQEGILGLC
ncbi:uncharacterized protein [Amphiura filiformis]|uniref:uncharacterized protein n=1 Tax=Amphiura filiformis TaxID=82378 RepID=UPI003B2214A5